MRRATLTCGRCGARVGVYEDEVDATGRCPSCGQPMSVPAETFSPSPGVREEPETSLSQQKVLVVDDEVEAVEFTRAVMEEAGFEVVVASDGEEALRKARTERPDVVILDLLMPGKGGFATFEEMRRAPELKDIPVLMLSGAPKQTGVAFSAAAIGRHIGQEPEAFMEKPVDPEALRRAVEDLLRG
ncbi:MAG: response regulator [Planctomycetota bacterium]|jgi:two-component system alkaline phosphatase synthesis response regulator PhoP